MTDRIDETVAFGDLSVAVTGKRMRNGERRLRVRFPTHGEHSAVATLTIATQDGWQEPHYHRGLTEVYTVTDGSIVIALLAEGGVESHDLGAGDSLTVPSGVEHNVCVRAGAEFLTTVTGKPVGNSDRQGNDWFPISEDSPLHAVAR